MVRPIDKWIIALTVMLPTLMVIIDTSVVNVSLDHIRGSLSAGIDEATWSITSYLAANAVIIPMLIPLALHGVSYRPSSAVSLLKRNMFIYGFGGLALPFLGIKLLDMIIVAFKHTP